MSATASSTLDALTSTQLQNLITRALEEDVGSGDITTLSTVPAASISIASFLAKETGTLSGLAVATEVFKRIDESIAVVWTMKDGDKVEKGTYFGTATGSTRSLLVAERLVLNLMQRMSGIASSTSLFVSTLASSHTRLLDTRKTVPGLRMLDKLAVVHGGGVNHRIGLYDMVMIKDNHIEAAGGIANAVNAVHDYMKANPSKSTTPIAIEVEARTLAEVSEVLAISAKVNRIMLDNMVKYDAASKTVNTSMLEQALALIRDAKLTTKLETEASGNVNLNTIHAIGKTGVDFISVGALTHSVMALDISMKIKLQK